MVIEIISTFKFTEEFMPAPTAKPIPAVAQIPAAVVSPLTICF